MEGENNTETVKIDIHLRDEGKTIRVVQAGETECLLEGNIKAESWIDQVKRTHASGKHKDRKTSAGVSIYRVPECIKKNKPEAYDPVTVFLGPYHHKKHQQLTAMDEYKLQTVDRTLERTREEMTIDQLLKQVGELEREIRGCYEDSAAEWDGDTLTWIMTMDACFILEFLRMDLPDSSLVFDSQRVINIKRREIMADIMKLENQIPFLVLKKILDLIINPVQVSTYLTHQLLKLDRYFQGYPFSLEIPEVMLRLPQLIEGGPHHLLDLSRQLIADFLSSSGSGSETAIPDKKCGCNVFCCAASCIATPNGVGCFRGASWTDVSRWLLRSSAVEGSFIPSAEKLHKAGIQLKASTEVKFHFERRCFQNSILYVTQITVEDDTEMFLRNLVAFEECQMRTYSPIKRVISSNMWIMDQLIDSKEDVKLFQRAGIIKNYLGTEDEVAKIFNDLCVGVTAENDYKDVLKMVNDRYKSQLNVWISEFRVQHCSRPWYMISFVVAVLLLVMTLLQTIYTMEGYFRSL